MLFNQISKLKDENEVIKALKQQVHQSFLQINEMEKLFHIEMQYTKKQLEQREQAIKAKQQQIRLKYIHLENQMKQCHFVINLGEIDDSHLLDQISYNTESSLRDSGIENFKQILSVAQLRKDPEQKIKALKELQKSVLSSIKSPPPTLYKLFNQTNEFCLQNCRLREQLLNCTDTIEIYKNKIQEATKLLTKLRNSEMNLKNQKQRQTKLYMNLVQKKENLQELLKTKQVEVQKKNKELIEVKQQYNKLYQSLKKYTGKQRGIRTSSEILDDSKIRFSGVTEQNKNKLNQSKLLSSLPPKLDSCSNNTQQSEIVSLGIIGNNVTNSASHILRPMSTSVQGVFKKKTKIIHSTKNQI